MESTDFKLQGLKLIKPKVFPDERGFFLESFAQDRYAQHGINVSFVQDNHSFSQQNCLRGLHFQTEPGQAKLIRAAVGKIWDVVVDIRPDSPSFKQWAAVELSGENHWQLFIPVGFAHGFCVLSNSAHVLYKTSALYNANTEAGFRWNDPEIAIPWPIQNPLVSKRDQETPFFKELKL